MEYFRLAPKTKKPNGTGWRHVPELSEEEANQWIEQGGNVGLRLAPTELVIDVDPRNGGTESAAQFEADFGVSLYDTMTNLTPTGRHHFFTIPPGTRIRKPRKQYPGLDFKKVGGFVVAPGSTHPEGGMYKRGNANPMLPLPEPVLNHFSFKPSEAKAPTGLGEYYLAEDLEKALDLLDPHEFANNDDWEALAMACHEITRGAGEDVFLKWSADDEEYKGLVEKNRDRWRSFTSGQTGNRGIGTLIHIFEEHGVSVTELPRLRMNFPTEKTAGSDFLSKVQSLEELYEESDEDLDWAVENLLLMGGMSALVARPKVGKSVLAKNMAVALAKGDSLFGRKVSKPRKVLYAAFSGEDTKQMMKNYFRLMGAEGPNIYTYVGPAPGVLPSEAVRELEHVINETGCDFIIVDTLFKFVNVDDGNAYAELIQVLKIIEEMAMRTGAHIMFIHHAGKKNSDAGLGGNILGSTAIFGAVQTMLFLEEAKDGKRYLKTSQRYGYPIESLPLEYDPDTHRLAYGFGMPSALDEAKEFLRTHLEGGPVEQSVIEQIAEDRGISERTLYRAKEDLKILGSKAPVFQGKVWWFFPENPPDWFKGQK